MLDHFEANSLATVFGDGPWPPLLVAKGALGHTLGGCVLVETAASLVALAHREIPQIMRCDQPDPALPIRGATDGSLPRDWTLLKCTNGFAGQNGAIVLRSVEA